MGGTGDSGKRRRRRIDKAAKAAFVAAARRGLRLEEAAAGAGASLAGFYGARRRDPAFRAEWTEALAASAEAERALCPHCGAPAGAERLSPNNKRRLQKRRMRQMRFDEKRRELFLAHFAASCDVEAAARAAGVDESTVYKHRRKDPAFAAAFDEALAQGYARLEAEALRQRLEAQKRMRRALDEGVPTGEIAAEFERVMRLLQRWDRKSDRPGVRAIAQSRKPALSFEESLALLERKLKSLDIPIVRLPPEIAARYDGDEGESGDVEDGRS